MGVNQDGIPLPAQPLAAAARSAHRSRDEARRCQQHGREGDGGRAHGGCSTLMKMGRERLSARVTFSSGFPPGKSVGHQATHHNPACKGPCSCRHRAGTAAATRSWRHVHARQTRTCPCPLSKPLAPARTRLAQDSPLALRSTRARCRASSVTCRAGSLQTCACCCGALRRAGAVCPRCDSCLPLPLLPLRFLRLILRPQLGR